MNFDEFIVKLKVVGVLLRENSNRRTLISLRHHKRNGWVLSVHLGLLQQPQLWPELLRFAVEQGRGRYPVLQTAMQEVFTQQETRMPSGPVSDDVIRLAQHQGNVQLRPRLQQIMKDYFSHLPEPQIRWGRNPGNRDLRSIRFGSYRSQPKPLIVIHPRLQRRWVASAFLDHVIHHECCHHAQACAPIPGEAAHSDRFYAWERSFASYKLAKAWERWSLSAMLQGVDAPPIQHHGALRHAG